MNSHACWRNIKTRKRGSVNELPSLARRASVARFAPLLRAAPRTDPYVKHYLIRLLPWGVDDKSLVPYISPRLSSRNDSTG